MGDISDTPPESAKTLKSLMSPEPELSDKPDFQEAAKEKRKDRSSRFFGSTSESKDHKETKEPFHPKLTKRLSSRSNGREKEKYREKTMDREDGMFHKELPMAGVVTKLNFTYTYTRKGGDFIFILIFRVYFIILIKWLDHDTLKKFVKFFISGMCPFVSASIFLDGVNPLRRGSLIPICISAILQHKNALFVPL